ncbi:SoxR-reducing system protein RseC [Morganella psychrotolerans]|uniref:SoxR reducing system protein RseC n=1 Tax=Morganella psychrotolerans TaxID=368603 RepID=A0A1B8HUJ5_9GAMM|nr:SoxR-reducing system protein RseC [Morganella psychrotolerans]OBU13553.1 SoxR reducing system protein RseC [Morganella psychrotolerans]
MVKEWATVVRWQDGRAVLRYGSSAGCGSCKAKAACGSYLLNKLGPEAEHQLEVPVSEALVAGQKVEVGIPEGSLLRSAMLVYLTPLLGLFIGAGLAQALTESQALVTMGGLLGGVAGFLLARKIGSHLGGTGDYEPVILQIGLPPSELSVEMNE